MTRKIIDLPKYPYIHLFIARGRYYENSSYDRNLFPRSEKMIHFIGDDRPKRNAKGEQENLLLLDQGIASIVEFDAPECPYVHYYETKGKIYKNRCFNSSRFPQNERKIFCHKPALNVAQQTNGNSKRSVVFFTAQERRA